MIHSSRNQSVNVAKNAMAKQSKGNSKYTMYQLADTPQSQGKDMGNAMKACKAHTALMPVIKNRSTNSNAHPDSLDAITMLKTLFERQANGPQTMFFLVPIILQMKWVLVPAMSFHPATLPCCQRTYFSDLHRRQARFVIHAYARISSLLLRELVPTSKPIYKLDLHLLLLRDHLMPQVPPGPSAQLRHNDVAIAQHVNIKIDMTNRCS